jgi:hypothetical protein
MMMIMIIMLVMTMVAMILVKAIVVIYCDDGISVHSSYAYN